MAKNRHLNKKEFDQLQKLKDENKRLKKQNSSLKKQLDRLDLQSERYDQINELVTLQYEEEKRNEEAAKLRKKWKCHNCGQGVLKLIIVPVGRSTKYFRKCTHCSKRTKMQEYDDSVKGVLE